MYIYGHVGMEHKMPGICFIYAQYNFFDLSSVPLGKKRTTLF